MITKIDKSKIYKFKITISASFDITSLDDIISMGEVARELQEKIAEVGGIDDFAIEVEEINK